MIHLESVWDENVFTIRGTASHERADQPLTRTEKGVRVERALPVWSERLGLVGKCDVVEFQFSNTGEGPTAVVPVEYKSGGPTHAHHAAIQLCAQALCLEEMIGVAVPQGALYFAKTKTRQQVALDASLRMTTQRMIESIRSMMLEGKLPPPVNDKRCPRCSLVDACLPNAVANLLGGCPDPYRPAKEVELP